MIKIIITVLPHTSTTTSRDTQASSIGWSGETTTQVLYYSLPLTRKEVDDFLDEVLEGM